MKYLPALGIAACLSLVMTAAASAQTGPVGDHYLSYRVNPLSAVFDVQVTDQFIPNTDIVLFSFEKFLNPVSQDGVPLVDETAHLTWWMANPNPLVNRQITVVNKFGEADWQVDQLVFLLAPGRKEQPKPPPDNINHYLCYQASGPPPGVDVVLEDQFLLFTTPVMEPRYFCNPCLKTHDGVTFPIVDPELHLAVYEVIKPPFVTPLVAFDQFGIHETFIDTFKPTEYLFVPSFKQTATPAEEATWGKIKSQFGR